MLSSCTARCKTTANRSRYSNEVLYPERREAGHQQAHRPYRDALQRALDTRKRIETAVAQTDDPGCARPCTKSTGNLDELTGTIYDLALKAQNLQTSLQGFTP